MMMHQQTVRQILSGNMKKYPDIIKPIYQTVNQYSQGIKISPTYLYPRAKGKYLAFCEGDDYWCDENKLQKQFDVMESNPDYSICVHRVSLLENGIVLDKFISDFKIDDNIIDNNTYIKLMMGGYYYLFQTSSYFIRMSLFDYKNKPEFWANSDVGDVPMILYCVSKGNLYYIGEVMSCYRNDSIGSWTNTVLKNALKMFEHTQKHLNYLIHMINILIISIRIT